VNCRYDSFMRTILNSWLTIWGLLALPGAAMLFGWLRGAAEAGELLHPSGETSARLMIVAMAIAPLMALIGPRGWLRWMLSRRRWFGVAAFGYAMLHTIFYIADMGNLDDMLAEIAAPGIWTAWAAMLFMTIVAIASNDTAMRVLRTAWKPVQRLAWPAAVLTLAHWILVHNNATAALVHFVPLAAIVAARAFRLSPRSTQGA
jgi:methionine sulfoxide reductase heme-binding subunit